MTATISRWDGAIINAPRVHLAECQTGQLHAGRSGRPSKFTDERGVRLLAALRAGNTRKASCLYAGVNEDSLERWLRHSADFAEALTRAEAEAEVALVAFVRQAAHTDWRAGMEFLSRRWPETWDRHYHIDFEL
jgi:hypothetical protein